MKWLVFFLLLFTVNTSNSQSLLRLQHINTEDGLSQNSVNAIFQSSQGFIWLATGDGLNRYDGKEFTVYKSSLNAPGSSRLPDRNINSEIFEDGYGKLWMASDAGTYYWDKRHAKSKMIIPNSLAGMMMLLAVEGDTLWGAVPARGVYALDTKNFGLAYYPFTDKVQRDSRIAAPIYNGSYGKGGMWFADEAGLLFFDKKTHTNTRIPLTEKLVSVHCLTNGNLLLGGVGGVYFFDVHTHAIDFLATPNEAGKEPFSWLAFTQNPRDNTVYMGATAHGHLLKLGPATRKYEILHFQDSRINRMCIDKSENLWIGTEGNGAFKLDIKPQKFFCYQPDKSATENKNNLMVKSIYRDDSGTIWMGTVAQGLLTYQPATRKQQNISLPFPVQDIAVTSVSRDSSGHIVVGGGSSIAWLDPATHKVIRHIECPTIKTVSPEPPVLYAILEWKKGHYIATSNIGLFLVTLRNGVAEAKYPDYFRYNNLGAWTYNLVKAPDGSIYQARRNGFSRINITGDTQLTINDVLNNVGVRHYYRALHAPILWIASEQGLIAYNEATKKYKVFDEDAGLANSHLYAILPENDSSLWISTNLGISHVQVRYGEHITIQAINYNSNDGLQSNEFNTGAFYKSDDGTLLFGGLSGVNWFNPKTIKPNPYKASPALGAIFVNDTLFASDTANFIQALELPFDRNTISLSLRALEFTQPANNMFAYMLEGLDKDWVYTGNDKVRYSNLQPGSYTFLLKASNNDGIWNETPLRMRIVIYPPYWQRWWFRALVLIVAASVVALIIRYYIKRKIVLKTLELEKQQALYLERLRISKDVHDDLGSGLSKISLMAEIAQTHLANNNAQNEIRHISAVSKDLIDNMRDLIWVLNPENTTLDNMVARIREYCADYLDGTPINAIFDFPDHIPQLAITREAQRNIFSTVKEAINNCVKHADASEVFISLKLENKMLRIMIKDNGKGITKNNSMGNGLRNMRQRIELVGGNFLMSSGSGNGTFIDISIPFEKMRSGAKNTTNV
jgi:signal transduction histidine kinase/ligand-binding sensor domain-containing protein